MGRIDLTREIKAAFNEQRKQIEKAEIIALNRAGKSALAQTVMFIRKGFNIKASDLKDQIKITRANKGRKIFRIEVTDKALALIKYGTPNQTKKGVMVTVRKGKRELYKSAFKIDPKYLKRGKENVFRRIGKERTPIRVLWGPTAMDLFSSSKAEAFIDSIFQEKFEKELIAAMKYGK